MPPMCHRYVTHMPQICHPYATDMPPICHRYATLQAATQEAGQVCSVVEWRRHRLASKFRVAIRTLAGGMTLKRSSQFYHQILDYRSLCFRNSCSRQACPICGLPTCWKTLLSNAENVFLVLTFDSRWRFQVKCSVGSRAMEFGRTVIT